MAMAPRLEMRQGQSLVMTPQLQQAIKLLQLSNLELAESVETEIERNPLLEREEADRRVVTGLQHVTSTLKQMGLGIDVRTELTGKASQAGSLEELLAWSRGVQGVHPCIDFSHHYARDVGAHNRYEDFVATLTAIQGYIVEKQEPGG